MGFYQIFIKMAELFFIVAIGYIGNKTHIVDKEARIKLTDIVLNITIPATALSSVLGQENMPGFRKILGLLLLACLLYVIYFLMAFLTPKLMRVPKKQLGIYHYMIAFGNMGFIGYPVTEAIFGKSALFYTCIFNIPFNFLAYSFGISFVRSSIDYKFHESRGEAEKPHYYFTKQRFLEIILMPCMIASVISVIISIVGWKGTPVVNDICEMLGDITTPAALLIIGSSLAEISPRDMFSNGRVYIMSIVKLIVTPMVTYFLLCPFIHEKILLGVAVVISGMPVAINGTMLCLQFGGDEKLMAQGTFLTTLASLISIPVLSMLF